MTNRYVGANKKKREQREKKTDGLQKFLAMLQGMQQKFINEWTEKHNQLAKLVDHVFKLATNEVGGLWANQQRIVDSVDHIDVNLLALAELNKKLYAHLHALRTEADGATFPVCTAAELYKKEMAECFTIVIERRKKEDEARKEAAEKAKADAKAAAEAKAEAERVEKVLMDAEKPKTLAEAMDPINNKGGQGVDIPEGAQVFGG
jgi:uncharacterized damage-inducible protein DinB